MPGESVGEAGDGQAGEHRGGGGVYCAYWEQVGGGEAGGGDMDGDGDLVEDDDVKDGKIVEDSVLTGSG